MINDSSLVRSGPPGGSVGMNKELLSLPRWITTQKARLIHPAQIRGL